MAGMFYSLKEVTERLNKTEDQIREIVKTGKLREFRDGPNLLFKVDEVEALMSDTNIMALEESSTAIQAQSEQDQIPEVPELAEPADKQRELSEADTIMADAGIDTFEDSGTSGITEDMLGETKATSEEVSLADDTIGDTRAVADEVSLEEIEEDVNLDTFGSGSGLLDLSLQADDTSLGGVLDEIYSPQAEGDKGVESEFAADVAAETEQMLAEPAAPGLAAPTPAVAGYVEPEPDAASNAFGLVLFLPLLVIIYTAIVTVAGINDVMTGLFAAIQGIIWYVMLGIVVAAGLIIAVPAMLSSGGAKKAKKPAKVKKLKARKEKKPKKKK